MHGHGHVFVCVYACVWVRDVCLYVCVHAHMCARGHARIHACVCALQLVDQLSWAAGVPIAWVCIMSALLFLSVLRQEDYFYDWTMDVYLVRVPCGYMSVGGWVRACMHVVSCGATVL